ncbi:hypothetical protein [Ruania alkalisoli]|nr:hypothetical protein [Ruania alkalisoli]
MQSLVSGAVQRAPWRALDGVRPFCTVDGSPHQTIEQLWLE